MNLSEINEKINQIGNTWEHYKQVNDERLKQIEKKGSVDGIVMEELNKINSSLDEQKNKLEKLEVSISRPSFENKNDYYNENIEYKKALNSYLKKGMENQLFQLERKSVLDSSISGETTAYGGYLLSPSMQKIITGELTNNCFMRQISSVQTISSSALEIIDDTSFATNWIAENGTVEDSDVSVLNKKTIKVHELVAQPKVTQKLLDDASINIEEWLAYRLAEQFAQKEEEAFLKGTGDENNQPTGITNYTSDIELIESTSATAGGITAKDIVQLYYSLKEQYVNRASFVMPRSAVSAIRMLKDETSGAYLWQPALLGGKEDTLMGCPVYQSAYMPELGANSLSIIFGDFKFYQIVDRKDISILRDPYTAKPYVRFYTTKRVGGDIIRTEAFKMLQCGA